MFSLPTILFAEDDPDLTTLLLSALETDYRVTAVRDGVQAMEQLEKQVYDLVLMDISMPGLSGVEVCRQMKQDPRLAGIPVFFLTAFEDPNQLDEAFAAGAVDYLTKPLAIKELRRRIQTRVQLNLTERELRNQLARRDLMLQTLSHDLRGPVGTTGSLVAKLAKHPALPEEVKPLAQAAAQSAQQSYALLEDMLTWAQAVGDTITFTPVWLALDELGKECLQLLRLRAEQKGLQLVLGIPVDMQIYADPHLLKSILLNLLRNALKFTSHGTVALRATQTPGQVIIHVEDTGPGIPDTVMTHLAQHLPIVSQPGTDGERGTGMGLKICQEFVAFHDGLLLLTSPADGGTTAALVLPQPPPKPARSL